MGTDLNNRVIPLSNSNTDNTVHFRWGSIAAEILVQENPSGRVTNEFSCLGVNSVVTKNSSYLTCIN